MYYTLGKKVKDKYGKDFYASFKVGDRVCQKYLWQNKNMTPLGIDLDRSEAVKSIRGEFVIDITGDSFIETFQDWFAPTEVILIDTSIVGLEHGFVTGHHLFGNMGGAYLVGFEKLATHDLNGDGEVGGDELEFSAIWTDATSNTKLDDGELSTLASHDIVGLNSAHKNWKSTVILSDGSSLLMDDLVFAEEELETNV
jgi:hypothetical protein